MRPARRPLLLAALASALAAPAGADLIFLKSGKVLSGKLTAGKDGIEVGGQGQTVVIAYDLVEKFEVGRELADLVREKFRETAGDADSLYRLGRWFSDAGLADPAAEAWKQAIAKDPEHLLARRALGQVKHEGQWLSHREVAKKAGLVSRGGSWVVPGSEKSADPVLEQAPAGTLERLAWAAKRLPELVREGRTAQTVEAKAKNSLARRQVTRALVQVLLREETPAHREKAARILGENGELSALVSLVRSSVADKSDAVRRAAVEALNTLDEPHTAAYYVRPLAHENKKIRENAIEVLGALKGGMASEVLVKRLMAVYGGGPRVHIYVGNQISYIKDYEVEVAQSAAVADPEIGYVQTGVVLEVQVLRIEEYWTIHETRLIASALEKRTGLAYGADPNKWLAWWKAQQPRAKN